VPGICALNKIEETHGIFEGWKNRGLEKAYVQASVESRTTGIHNWPHVSDNLGAVPFESVIDLERGEISIEESQIGTIPERYRRIYW